MLCGWFHLSKVYVFFLKMLLQRNSSDLGSTVIRAADFRPSTLTLSIYKVARRFTRRKYILLLLHGLRRIYQYYADCVVLSRISFRLTFPLKGLRVAEFYCCYFATFFHPMNPSSELNQLLSGPAESSIQSPVLYTSTSSDTHNLPTEPPHDYNLLQLSGQDSENRIETILQNISDPFPNFPSYFELAQSPESLQSPQSGLSQVLAFQQPGQENQQNQIQGPYQNIQHHQGGLQQFQQSQELPVESQENSADFLDFHLPESHFDLVGQSVFLIQETVAMGTEKASRGDLGLNGEGATVEIIEQLRHRSAAKDQQKNDDGLQHPDKRAHQHTIESSPFSCEAQEKVSEILGTPITPHMPTIPTAKGSRRTGRGKRQPLASPHGVFIDELQLPVVQEDPLVRYCKDILHKEGKHDIEKDGLDLYNQRLQCLEDATEQNKVLERKKLKSKCEPVENHQKADQASRIEAELSRYRKNVFKALSLEEWKRLREGCTVLEKYISEFILERNVNLTNCPKNGSSSANNFGDAGSGPSTLPVKRRKIE